MKKILPVIHVETEEQAERNLLRAFRAGADGVFLINHAIHASDLVVIFRHLRTKYPGQWIGVNYLGLPPYTAARLAEGASGLWMDGYPKANFDLKIPIFAGVAFKYQMQAMALSEEVQVVGLHSNVLVTSGPETGTPPSVGKLEQLRNLTAKPLGIASGLTPENVGQFLPFASYFLVATGVSSSFTELDEDKLRAFVKAVHG
jgi:uncharacterized protein